MFLCAKFWYRSDGSVNIRTAGDRFAGGCEEGVEDEVVFGDGGIVSLFL